MWWRFAEWFGPVQRGYAFLAIGLALGIIGILGDLFGHRWGMGLAGFAFVGIGLASIRHGKTGHQ